MIAGAVTIHLVLLPFFHFYVLYPEVKADKTRGKDKVNDVINPEVKADKTRGKDKVNDEIYPEVKTKSMMRYIQR